MPIVLKSGSHNLLEPSGPVEVCNGIALPFTSVCRSTLGFRLSVIDPVHNAKIHIVDAVDTSLPELLYIEFREAPLCSEISSSA